MMNIMIVDDEKHACDRLVQLVSEIPGCYVKACAQDGLDAVEKASALNLDVVLMDIHMPVMDGLEAARHINKTNHAPQIIFTTAYRQHAYPAFEVNASGFLLKPIVRGQLTEKLVRMQSQNTVRYVREAAPSPRERRSYIYCRIANQLELIAVDDIIYFKSEQKYTMVKHVNGSHLIDETLKHLEQEFNDILMRVHRNALVNKAYMKSLGYGKNKHVQLLLKCTNDSLALSRGYIHNIRTYLKQFSI